MDCSKTENYFKEKARMTKSNRQGFCDITCNCCPLNRTNSGLFVSCTRLERSYTQKAVEIVQKWSDEHPKKTFLSEFLKHYPNVQLDSDGVPDGICLATLGLCEDCVKMDESGNAISERDCTCMDCWNTPIEEQ